MRLLLKAALQNRRHFLLLIFTLISMLLLTFSSQLEIFSLGVMAKTGPDFFSLFGDKNSSSVTLDQVTQKWPEISEGTRVITKEMADRYLFESGNMSLVQKITHFLDRHFQIASDLKRLAFFLVFIALFKACSLFFNRYSTQLVSIRVSRDLRQRYFEHIQSLPMTFYQEYNTGSLSSRVFGDASSIANALNSLLLNYIQTPFAAITTLVACFLLSWKLSLIIFVGFPVVLLPIIILSKKIKLIAKQLQRNQEGFTSVLIDFLSGILTVKVFAMEEFSLKKYREQNYEMAKLEEKSARYGLASRPILHTASSLFFAAVILSGLYLFHMSPTDLLVFCGLLYLFYEPIKKFSEENVNVLRGLAAAERMEEVLSQHSPIVDEPSAVDLTEFKSEISFNNVAFRYKDHWILRKLSFTVKKGETVAIVGPTGAGKSTIVQLLPRLWDIQEGTILIDGKPIRSYTIRSLRESIAFVPQKPFLFLDSIHENIAFGREFSRTEVEEAAQRAHADEFIVRLPQKYDSMLAEGGKNLSGGQQQRLAIARALVKRAPILILDEATSSLDAVSESKIKEAIVGLHGSVTQIIIAHRFSTIEHADKIIYVDRGSKISEGTKDQLLLSCPGFKQMWEMMKIRDNN